MARILASESDLRSDIREVGRAVQALRDELAEARGEAAAERDRLDRRLDDQGGHLANLLTGKETAHLAGRRSGTKWAVGVSAALAAVFEILRESGLLDVILGAGP